MSYLIGYCDPSFDRAEDLSTPVEIGVVRVLEFEAGACLVQSARRQDERVAPSGLLALAAATPEGLSLAETLAGKILAETDTRLEVLNLLETTRANRRKAISEHALRVLAQRALEAEKLVGALSEALATLRREHEVVVGRFVELEACIVGQNVQPERMVCLQERVDAYAEIGPGTKLGASAAFSLPFGTLGLCRIELMLDGSGASGTLEIGIETMGGRQLAGWAVPLDHDAPDWRTFERMIAMPQSHQAARLVLGFAGAGIVRIGAGPRHPAKRVWLLGETGESEPRHIAMRATVSSPGIRTRTPPPDLAPNAIKVTDIGAAVQVAPEPEAVSDLLVSRAPEGGLLIIPSFGTLVAARMPRQAPRGIGAITAIGMVAHPEGAPAELALAVGAGEAIAEMIFSEAFEDSDLFSAWTPVDAMSPVPVTFELNKPSRGGEDVFVLARIAPGASHDWFCRCLIQMLQLVPVESDQDG